MSTRIIPKGEPRISRMVVIPDNSSACEIFYWQKYTPRNFAKCNDNCESFKNISKVMFPDDVTRTMKRKFARQTKLGYFLHSNADTWKNKTNMQSIPTR